MGWAEALQGLGAGLSGQGPQWVSAQAQKQETANKERETRILAMARDGLVAQNLLQAGRTEQALNWLKERKAAGEGLPDVGLGTGMKETESLIAQIEANDIQGAYSQLSAATDAFRSMGILEGVDAESSAKKTVTFGNGASQQTTSTGNVYLVTPSGQRIPSSDPGYQVALADAVKSGVFQEQAMAAAGQAGTQQAQAGMVPGAPSEAWLAGQAQGAKSNAAANVRGATEPVIAGNIVTAQETAKNEAERAVTAKSNQIAFDTYNTAATGLLTGLEGTTTGPIVGVLPALTAGAQMAEGGVAAMAPVLKQLFRSSGEGVFTDRDQALLMDMLPTREDLPQARAFKLANIDAIVRSKLSIPQAGGVAPTGAPTQKQGGPKFLGFE